MMFLGSKVRGGCVGLTTLPHSVSRLSRQCEILNISQPYRPARPVTGIAVPFFFTLRTGRTLLPRNIIFLLLVLISVRGRVIPRA
jgi:hypothetical protein